MPFVRTMPKAVKFSSVEKSARQTVADEIPIPSALAPFISAFFLRTSSNNTLGDLRLCSVGLPLVDILPSAFSDILQALARSQTTWRCTFVRTTADLDRLSGGLRLLWRKTSMKSRTRTTNSQTVSAQPLPVVERTSVMLWRYIRTTRKGKNNESTRRGHCPRHYTSKITKRRPQQYHPRNQYYGQTLTAVLHRPKRRSSSVADVVRDSSPVETCPTGTHRATIGAQRTLSARRERRQTLSKHL